MLLTVTISPAEAVLVPIPSPSPAAWMERQKSCTTIPSQVLAPQLEMQKARNQSRGWCFAFSTADLLSVKLGEPVSAFGLANSYYRDAPLLHEGAGAQDIYSYIMTDFDRGLARSGLDLEGGFPARLLGTAIENGFVCLEKTSPSEFPVEQSGPGTPSDDDALTASERFNNTVSTIEEAYDQIETLLEEEWDLERIEKELDHFGIGAPSRYRLGQIDSGDPHQTKVLNNALCENEDFRQAMKDLFPRVSIKEFLRIAQESTRGDLIQNLSRNNCEAIPVPGKKFKIRSLAVRHKPTLLQRNRDVSRLISVIDRQLSARNPVIATYDSVGLFSPAASVGAQFRNGKTPENGEFVHASLITGRHWDEEQKVCRYEVKNSWGPDCKSISPQMLCDRGILYPTEDQLRDMLYGLDWLE